jgi:arabinofuranosyltransferase
MNKLLSFLNKYKLYIPIFPLFTLLLIHINRFSFFVSDDAYISFRYARNLSEYGQLTFTLGERVEGYSNFLWTVLLGGFHFVGFSIPIISIILGVGFSMVSLLILWKLSIEIKGNSTDLDHIIHWSSPLILVLWAPFAAWSSGGLETMMFTTLALFSIFLTIKKSKSRLLWGASWVLTALTRPEGAILFTIAFIWLFIDTLADYFKEKQGFQLLALFKHFLPLIYGSILFSITYGIFFLWRIYYYGEILPNTWYAKIYGIPPSFLFKHGLIYINSFIEVFKIFWLLPILGGIFFLGKKTIWKLILPFSAILFWFYYSAKVGGDFMALFRFMVPALPLMALLLSISIFGWSALFNRFLKKRSTLIISSFLILYPASLIGYLSFNFENISISKEKVQFGMESIRGMINYANDRVMVGKALGRIIKAYPQRDVSLAVGGAGAISFESRAAKIIDTFGLMDKSVARKKIKAGKFFKPGHLKQAPWRYIKSLSPDILCTPGIAYIGRRYPNSRRIKRVLAYWRNYHYFCLDLPLSSNDRGVKRKRYCCLKRKDLFPGLNNNMN